MNKLTITKHDIQSQVIDQCVAFGHVPGKTKWLHFVYDIGHEVFRYRMRRLNSSEDQVQYFDDLELAIEAFNKQ